MSTSPESAVVNVLSRWLAGHVTNQQVERELERVDAEAVGGEGAELRALLAANGHGGELERLVRETLEAVALGA
jgi:hypothetical protein